MSFLKKLFGGGGGAGAKERTEVHGEFRIVAAPMRDGSSWRLAGRVEKGEEASLRVHQFIRADTFQDETTAGDATIAKAKQLIDEQGDRLFD